MAESHKYCNAFSLIVIGRGTDDEDLLDCNGESFSIVQSLIDQIGRISTLFNKPKFLLVQRYVSGNNELRKLKIKYVLRVSQPIAFLFQWTFRIVEMLLHLIILLSTLKKNSLSTDTDYEAVSLPDFPKRKDLCLVYGIKNENPWVWYNITRNFNHSPLLWTNKLKNRPDVTH